MRLPERGNYMLELIESGLKLKTVYVNEQGEKRLIVAVTDGVVIWKTADPDLPFNRKSQGSIILNSFQKWIRNEHPASEAELAAFEKVILWRKYNRQITQEIEKIKKRMKLFN